MKTQSMWRNVLRLAFYTGMLSTTFWLIGCEGSATETTNSFQKVNTIKGTVHNEDGSVAKGVKVKIVPVDYVPHSVLAEQALLTDTIFTDEKGNFQSHALSEGRYNVFLTWYGAGAFEDSVPIINDSVTFMETQLHPLGSLSGKVQLQSGADPRKIFIVGIGTDISTSPDSQGVFTTGKVPAGKYLFRFLSSLDDYRPLDLPLTVVASAVDTLRSSVTLATRNPLQLALPVSSPPGGTFMGSVAVTLSHVEVGAKICYSINGVDPDSTCSNGTLTYSLPMKFTVNTTLRARAVKANFISSNVATWIFTITASKLPLPISTPPGGFFTDSVSVTLSDSVAGVKICYTINGMDPDTSCSNGALTYTSPLRLGDSTTLKARATKAGFLPSDVATWVFLKNQFKVATPVASPPGDTIDTIGINVTLNTSTAGATICYTLTNVDPDSTCSNGTGYTAPIFLTQTTTLKARAVKAGMIPSDLLVEKYLKLIPGRFSKPKE